MVHKEIDMLIVISDKYEISTGGVITNIKTGKIIKHDNSQRYSRVRLFNDNKVGKKFLVHRLVAESFLPKICGKNIVNHIDGDYYNNDVSNLEWVTQQENVRHAWDNGLAVMTQEKKDKLSKKVIQLTLDGDFVKEWKSTKEAGANGYTQSSVSQACNGIRKKHKGFIWKWN
jgi:hypothetical protein